MVDTYEQEDLANNAEDDVAQVHMGDFDLDLNEAEEDDNA